MGWCRGEEWWIGVVEWSMVWYDVVWCIGVEWSGGVEWER